MGIEKARRQLELARKQLERVQIASWDPQDAEEAVTWAFYAYENAVVAAAEIIGLPWKKRHDAKRDVAEELYRREVVSKDLSSELRDLNDLRKDVAYGEPGAELAEVDLEALAVELEEFVNEVDALLEKAAQ